MKNKNWKKYIWIFLLIILIIIIDQIIKQFVYLNNSDINLINNILKFKYVENSGIAFGISSNLLGVIISDIIVLGILLRYMIVQFEQMNKITKFSISIILAGGFSNLIDRIIRGKVVDYIDISQIISRFPVLNLADICIVVGFVIFVIIVGYNIFKVKKVE